MKPYKIFGLCIIVLTILMTFSSFAKADLTTNLISYWKFDENTGSVAEDSAGTNNGTISGASWTTGKINSGLSFDGKNDYTELSRQPEHFTKEITIAGWFKIGKSTNYQQIISLDGRSSSISSYNSGGTIVYSPSNALIFTIGQGIYSSSNDKRHAIYVIDLNTTQYYHIVGTFKEGSHQKLYINGEVVYTRGSTHTGDILFNNYAWAFGRYYTGASLFNGSLDEVAIWNRSLNDTEISQLYNSGTGLQYPFATNFSITTNLNDFNVTMVSNETLKYNATSTILETDIKTDDARLWNITIQRENYQTITYTNYNISLNGSITTTLSPSTKVSFKAKNVITETEISNFNITYNGTTYNNTELIYILTGAGNYTFTFSKESYYSKNQTFYLTTTTEEQIKTFTNVYQTIISLDYKDIETNTTINQNGTFNFTYNGIQYQQSFTNGTHSFNALYGDYSNIKARIELYAYNTPVDFTANTTTTTLTYYFYKDKSVWFYIKDFSTGVTLSDFNVLLYNENNVYENATTNTSELKLNYIDEGFYKVLLAKEGYYTGEYFLTIIDGSHQTLTGYLINTSLDASSTTILTLENIATTNIITGGTISMYKLINSSWVLVSSKYSDITGRALFPYVNQIEYKFVIDANGFSQRNFLLMPIYSTYTIRMTPNTTTYTDISTGWNYFISNNGFFYNDETNTFDISVSSGWGTIEYYTLSIIEVDGTTQNFSCSNAYGCSNSISTIITDASTLDTTQVILTIKETTQPEKTFTYSYKLENIFETYTIWGWGGAINSTTGLRIENNDIDDLDKVLLATLVMLVFVATAGTISVSLGIPPITPTGMVLTFFAFMFSAIGFIPTYSAYIIGLGTLLILLFGKGQI